MDDPTSEPTEAAPLRNPVVIAAFEGWNDAADAASDALRFLQRSFKATEVHVLDIQEYSDFQAARPHVELNDGVVRSIRWLSTTISVARVPNGDRDLILVLGIEPNLRWKQFCDEILSFASIEGATTVVTLGALLGDAPHTRPLPVTGTANDPATAERLGLQRSQYEGPTGIIGVLSDAARRADFESVSLWVPVPHYTSVAPNPLATLTLLERLGTMLQVPLELSNLGVAARGWQAHVDSLVEVDGDLTEYVHQLEARYDTDEAIDIDLGATTGYDFSDDLFDDDFFDDDDDDFDDEDFEDDDEEDEVVGFDENDLPTGDALAEDFERYLRNRPPDDPPVTP